MPWRILRTGPTPSGALISVAILAKAVLRTFASKSACSCLFVSSFACSRTDKPSGAGNPGALRFFLTKRSNLARRPVVASIRRPSTTTPPWGIREVPPVATAALVPRAPPITRLPRRLASYTAPVVPKGEK